MGRRRRRRDRRARRSRPTPRPRCPAPCSRCPRDRPVVRASGASLSGRGPRGRVSCRSAPGRPPPEARSPPAEKHRPGIARRPGRVRGRYRCDPVGPVPSAAAEALTAREPRRRRPPGRSPRRKPEPREQDRPGGLSVAGARRPPPGRVAPAPGRVGTDPVVRVRERFGQVGDHPGGGVLGEERGGEPPDLQNLVAQALPRERNRAFGDAELEEVPGQPPCGLTTQFQVAAAQAPDSLARRRGRDPTRRRSERPHVTVIRAPAGLGRKAGMVHNAAGRGNAGV